jgi:hypothetical protein
MGSRWNWHRVISNGWFESLGSITTELEYDEYDHDDDDSEEIIQFDSTTSKH